MNQVTPLKPPALVTGNSIAPLVPTSFADVATIAEHLSRSEMVPRLYIGKPANAVVAIMFGMEVGLPPFAALQNIAVVNGKPSLYGDGQLAVVMGRGQLEDIEEKIDGEGETMGATCRVKRKGLPSPTVRRFTVADAKRAGLWGKQGPWQQYPKRMLQMRARAIALRDTFADHLLGLSAEEASDGFVGPEHAKDVTPATARPASNLDALEEIIGPTDPNLGQPAAEDTDAETGEILEPEAAPTYDPAREYDALLEGAMAETTAAAVRDYWAIQGLAANRLREAAPDLYTELHGKVSARIKALKGAAA